jgi:hypothetical protein
MLSIVSGYDPGYLTRAVAAGRENYYLSAVAEHGEPPGIWTGVGCPELGLLVGSDVDGPGPGPATARAAREAASRAYRRRWRRCPCPTGPAPANAPR